MNRSMAARAGAGSRSTRRWSVTRRAVSARRRPRGRRPAPVVVAGSTPTRSSATAWRTAAGRGPPRGRPPRRRRGRRRRRSAPVLERLDLGRPMQHQRDLVAGEPRWASRLGHAAIVAHPPRSATPVGEPARFEAAPTARDLVRKTPWSRVGSLGRDGTTVGQWGRRPVRGGRRGAAGASRRRWRRGCDRCASTTSSGQDDLVGPGRPLRVLVESDRLSSAIFWGPPGTGKTTLAQVIARHTAKAYEQLSAVSASVKDVREIVAKAEQRLGERGQGTILFLDEVHRFNKAQQDALLPSVESGLLVLVGRHDREPVLRGQRAAAVPLDACSASNRSTPRPSSALLRKGLDAEGADGRRPRRSTTWPSGPAATGATRSPASRWRSPWPGRASPASAHARPWSRGRRRGRARHQAAPLRPRRALRRDLGVHQEHPGLRSRGRRCTTWPACSRRARTPGSSPAAS